MLKKISHIGIAVSSLSQRINIYRDAFGIKVSKTIKMPERGLEIAFLEIAGAELELLAPLDDKSDLHKFIQKRGEGIHHICFEVDDIAAELKNLQSLGMELIDQQPRRGATGDLIAFIHPNSTGGTLIELKQKMA